MNESFSFLNLRQYGILESGTMMQVINKFSGEYSFLSNFYHSPFDYCEKSYKTIEHAFQAFKTLNESERDIIRKQTSPAKAKHAGRRVTLREDWEIIKCKIMEKMVRIKFTTNITLREKLIKTYPAELIEGNTWGDTFWGVCNGSGANHLGKILIKVRKELMEEDVSKRSV